MLLQTAGGESFAVGSATYGYRPAGGDFTNRIILEIEVEQHRTLAIVDTGSPFGFCPPDLAGRLALNLEDALEQIRYNIRGNAVTGHLYRLALLFPADEGSSLLVDATVFVPDPGQ